MLNSPNIFGLVAIYTWAPAFKLQKLSAFISLVHLQGYKSDNWIFTHFFKMDNYVLLERDRAN